ncbi:MAG: hypothetical protein K9M45_10195 [Kiritimatiellales bacterium]|nr:hypothetical protein [Kiritimatiellales bacterium]
MVMVIGLLVVLWNYDLHNIVSTKFRIDNAGDAGALAAARWQGITLNMIGELNLIQAAYVCDSLVDPDDLADIQRVQAEVEEIATLRSRLALNGPLMGLVAAQSAALLNLNEKDELNREDDFANFIADRAADFESSGGYYQGVVEEPYSGAWEEYGALLASIANNKMVVECANAEYFLFYNGSHTLLDPGFYQAVAGSYWCWFRHGEKRVLINSYQAFTDWDPLPDLDQRSPVNAEYFGTDLKLWDVSLNTYYNTNGYNYVGKINDYYGLDVEPEGLADQFMEHTENISPVADADTGNLPYVVSIHFPWHYYLWSSWLQARYDGRYWPTSDDFPFQEGWKVKEEYDYGGANAAVDCYINAVNITPNMRVSSDWIYWQASAKAFGYLDDPDGSGERRSPVYFGLVLPSFHDVRLIHNRMSSRSGGVKQPGYDVHIYQHLPEYVEGGLEAIQENDCWYCRQLERWEEQEFRKRGADWLDENEEECGKFRYEGDPHMGRG